MPGGGPPGGSPPPPGGGMNDQMAMQVVQKHNISPDDLPVLKEAIAYLEMKMGGGGQQPAPMPPMPPQGGPPMGPPGVA